MLVKLLKRFAAAICSRKRKKTQGRGPTPVFEVVVRIEDTNDESRTKFVAGLNAELNRRQKARLLEVVTPSGEKKKYTRTRNERAPDHYYY